MASIASEVLGKIFQAPLQNRDVTTIGAALSKRGDPQIVAQVA